MTTTDQAYQAALDYLNRFIDYEKGMPYSYSPALFNLARTDHLLEGLGHPERAYPSLLIAGTKGKGSTAAFLERILRAAGWRTGLYISPHMHTWRERVQVNRRPIAKGEVVAWIERMRPLVEAMPEGEQGPPTYYEISTALALGYFAQEEIDVAVLEVGLGGRLDATNVVTPRVSILTTIGYDHVEILGDTLAKIAREKAAIVKPAGWAVSAPQEEEAMAVIEAACRRQGAVLWVAQSGGIRQIEPRPAGPWPYPVPVEAEALSLRGFFQQINARVALAAIRAFQEQGGLAGPAETMPVEITPAETTPVKITPEAMAEGLAKTRWPGRLEVIEGTPPLVLDGAHNVDSARVLRRALQEIFTFNRLIVIVGFSKGHDVARFIDEIGALADQFVVTAADHPRAADRHEIAAAVRQQVSAAVEVADDVAAALDRAREIAAPDDLICACGSLFIAGGVREALGLAEEVD